MGKRVQQPPVEPAAFVVVALGDGECTVARRLPDGRVDRAGLNDGYLDAPPAQLTAEPVRDGFQGKLRCRVGGCPSGDQSPVYGGDVDDAAPTGAKQRKHGSSHSQRAEHVDLELAAEFIERDRLERTGHHDARVVDQSPQRATSCSGNRLRGCGDLRLVGDVEPDGYQLIRCRRTKPLGIGIVAVTGEYPEAQRVEMQGARPPDALGGTGDQDGTVSGGGHGGTRGSKRAM